MKYTLVTLSLIAGMASAHEGHNHAAWDAGLLHAVWLAPIAVAALAAVYLVMKKIKK